MKAVWDIETNGLDHTHVWCLAVLDVESGVCRYFTDHDDSKPSMREGLKLLDTVTTHIGHNLIGFDIPALEQHYQWKVSENAKVVDTMLLSQLNDFYRPSLKKASMGSGKGNHAMATYGIAMGQLKEEDPDWNVYSPDMESRCVGDVHLNLRMYNYLMRESKVLLGEAPGYREAIRLEHEFAELCAEQSKNGWMFDKAYSEKLIRLIDKRMEEIAQVVEPNLKPRKVWIDQHPREVKYLKDGRMDRVSREWFADKPVEQTYRRFQMVDTDLGNNEAVRELLLENGWKPTEYNWKKDKETGKKIRMAPKLTEDSYDSITGELGRLVSEWRTLRSRRGLLVGLNNLQREDGRVSCDAFTIGTNTFRVRHRGIVNIPGNDALVGAKVRKCFIAPPGRVLVSADSDSNQLRGFAHYLNNQEVTEAIVSGSNEDGTDVHSRTAGFLEVARPTAKNVTYATLFGAKDAKLAETAGMKGQGAEIREKMELAFPGFQALTEETNNEWVYNAEVHGRGFVTGLDGRRIYCEQHKAFNAKLQAFEAVTCKEAAVHANKLILAEGLDSLIVCHYHDEMTWDTHPDVAQRVGEILEEGFGPHITEKYNLNCPMGGTAQIGFNWSEIH